MIFLFRLFFFCESSTLFSLDSNYGNFDWLGTRNVLNTSNNSLGHWSCFVYFFQLLDTSQDPQLEDEDWYVNKCQAQNCSNYQANVEIDNKCSHCSRIALSTKQKSEWCSKLFKNVYRLDCTDINFADDRNENTQNEWYNHRPKHFRGQIIEQHAFCNENTLKNASNKVEPSNHAAPTPQCQTAATFAVFSFCHFATFLFKG